MNVQTEELENVPASSPKPNSEKIPLKWFEATRFVDAHSSICVIVNHARLEGERERYLYTCYISYQKYENYFSQYIPVIFTPQSMKDCEPQPVWDYAGVIQKLMAQATEYILEKKKANLLYDRDMWRAQRDKPREMQRIGSNGKTQREREKKKNQEK